MPDARIQRPIAQGLVDDGPPFADFDAPAIAAALRVRARAIGALALAGGALLLLVSFVLPPVYVASVSVLEAPRREGGSALEQLGLSASMLGLKAGGGTSNALTYPDILRSRRLLEGLLGSSFALKNGRRARLEEYLIKAPASPQRTEKALQELRQRFDIALDRRTTLLRLGVSDRDPVLAAAVANAACGSLQDLVMHAMMTQAGANRRFIETRMSDARRDLAAAEGALEGFRERNRHPEDAPRLALEQGRLLRELRTREEVLIALTREYEMARVDENRDVPVLNVLDPAQPPAFRSSPRRGIMTVAGAALGLCVGIAMAWPRRARAGHAGTLEVAKAA